MRPIHHSSLAPGLTAKGNRFFRVDKRCRFVPSRFTVIITAVPPRRARRLNSRPGQEGPALPVWLSPINPCLFALVDSPDYAGMNASPAKKATVVSVALPGLGITVRFVVRPYPLHVPDASATLTTTSLRLFLPEGIETGRPVFLDGIATRWAAARNRLPGIGYFDSRNWLAAILLQDIKSRLDPRRRRTFLLSSLGALKKSRGKHRRYETFARASATTGVSGSHHLQRT